MVDIAFKERVHSQMKTFEWLDNCPHIQPIILIFPKSTSTFQDSAQRANSWGQKEVIFFKNSLTRSVLELEFFFFFFKWVRISPEIDWYHYQSANAAPKGTVRHRIKTDQFSRSVTSEPTVK